MRFPLQGAVSIEISHVSLDDSVLAYALLGSLESGAPLAWRVRFAAQIVFGGFYPALSFNCLWAYSFHLPVLTIRN